MSELWHSKNIYTHSFSSTRVIDAGFTCYFSSWPLADSEGLMITQTYLAYLLPLAIVEQYWLGLSLIRWLQYPWTERRCPELEQASVQQLEIANRICLKLSS